MRKRVLCAGERNGRKEGREGGGGEEEKEKERKKRKSGGGKNDVKR